MHSHEKLNQSTKSSFKICVLKLKPHYFLKISLAQKSSLRTSKHTIITITTKLNILKPKSTLLKLHGITKKLKGVLAKRG
jgi:hypothetical protein